MSSDLTLPWNQVLIDLLAVRSALDVDPSDETDATIIEVVLL